MKSITEEKIYKVINEIETICYNQCYLENKEEKKPGRPILERDLAPQNPEIVTKSSLDLIYNLTASILTKLYGSSSEHVSNFQSQLSDFNYSQGSYDSKDLLQLCIAKIEFIKTELRFGLINSIQNEITSDILANMLSLARVTLNDNIIPVAAVLCCASLEDSLKRVAISNNLEVENKTMSEVVNSLKSIGVISSAQGTILKGYTQIRNNAFHADWTKIEKADISSIIGFTESFILQKLSN